MALGAGAFFQENLHPALQLCVPAVLLLQRRPCRQPPTEERAKAHDGWRCRSVTGLRSTPGRNGFCSLSPGRELVTGTSRVLWDFRATLTVCTSVCSESAFQQAVAPAPGGTHLLGPKPLHHVASVSPMPAGQAEVGRPSNCDVADGALEREAFADGALRATDLAAAVAAVHAELWKQVGAARQDT